ncbi:hypothetical protein TanjilG_30021 [Lupinus angustifolius]|uniref:DRBM domain-containing protein n=1 Tax=Lupinus angustifolius TaxID=3871 RepID=A0A4P1R6D3_LUPAN|nr:hypothetical protein TanjilG_30021 [Lupinus angustifolius]
MAPSEVCATEDAVKVFLEYLVDPMLPAKSTSRDNPTLSQQQSVAKQVYSVVLLYNYYHRKQHPQLVFLKFDEFCKLVVVLRPPLLAYMKYMQKPDETELVDAEKQLSLTEKKIMDACDICTCLDASKNVPNIKGWPISKVAVLLIDGEKKNCVLLFSSITEGVWSVLEKDAVTSSQSSEVTNGTMVTYIKRRVIKKCTKDESNVDDSAFLQIGYSAVKEAAGINKTDLTLLESCTVYSHSKEKAASRFYIMKSSQLISQEVNQVPIKDLIESEDQEIGTPSVQHYSNGSAALVKVLNSLNLTITFTAFLLLTAVDVLLLSNKVASELEAEKDDSTRMLITVAEIKNQSACNQKCANTSSEKAAVGERSLIPNHSNSDLEKLRTLLASKRETLSQTALASLIGKRNELALQQRMIEDEIALCDKKIEKISSGVEDELEIKIESIIEGCNDIWELDGICHENNWILPTYRVSHSDGGFQANVIVKGPDFEFSCGDNTFTHPLEARESAAAQVLAKLRNMAKSDH